MLTKYNSLEFALPFLLMTAYLICLLIWSYQVVYLQSCDQISHQIKHKTLTAGRATQICQAFKLCADIGLELNQKIYLLDSAFDEITSNRTVTLWTGINLWTMPNRDAFPRIWTRTRPGQLSMIVRDSDFGHLSGTSTHNVITMRLYASGHDFRPSQMSGREACVVCQIEANRKPIASEGKIKFKLIDPIYLIGNSQTGCLEEQLTHSTIECIYRCAVNNYCYAAAHSPKFKVCRSELFNPSAIETIMGKKDWVRWYKYSN